MGQQRAPHVVIYEEIWLQERINLAHYILHFLLRKRFRRHITSSTFFTVMYLPGTLHPPLLIRGTYLPGTLHPKLLVTGTYLLGTLHPPLFVQ